MLLNKKYGTCTNSIPLVVNFKNKSFFGDATDTSLFWDLKNKNIQKCIFLNNSTLYDFLYIIYCKLDNDHDMFRKTGFIVHIQYNFHDYKLKIFLFLCKWTIFWFVFKWKSITYVCFSVWSTFWLCPHVTMNPSKKKLSMSHMDR